MKADQIEAIYQTIAYIENHLQEEISVADMAVRAGYSVFHFIRLFNQVVHHTPYDYLIRRRLTESAAAMAAHNLRIIDVAQDYCFNNQETYSRMFRKMFKVTPSQFRKTRMIPSFRYCPAKTLEDLHFINRYDGHSPQIEKIGSIPLYGLMTLLEPEPDNRLAQLHRVRSVFQASLKRKTEPRCYEIISRLGTSSEDHSWFIGAEESAFDGLPHGMVTTDIPAGEFATFDIMARDKLEALSYLKSTWLPGVGHQINREMEIIRWHGLDFSDLTPLSLLLPISSERSYPLQGVTP